MKDRFTLSRRRALQGIGAAAIVSSLPDLARAQNKADVLIIGAGMAGLHAAMILEEQGLSVIVIEGRSRIGGRVFTIDEVDGKPEAGASQIGPLHARVRSAIDQLGLKMYRPNPPWERLSMAIGDTLIRADQWKDSPLNKLQGDERKFLPWQLERHYMSKNDPLTSLESWLTPEMAKYDIPLLAYLQTVGASDEAIRMIALGNYAEDLREISALGQLRYLHFLRTAYKEGTFDYLTGGMMRLPEAMAAALKNSPRMGKTVVEIAQGAGGVSVRCSDGTNFSGKYALVTAPFSTLRDISLDPVAPPEQAAMIAQMPHVQMTQVFLEVTGNYWEEDGLAPGLWTDGDIERVFPLAGANKEIGVLWVTINGAGDRALVNLDEYETASLVMNRITTLRPAMKGKVRPAKVVSWSKDKFARGHLAYYAPGQIRNYKHLMAKPHGRMHFAGEHTAELAYGMEAAMESGERAALEILERG